MKTKIEKGDIVTVVFTNGESLNRMTVLHVPCATGDAFHLVDETGTLIYVQQYESIELKNDPA